MCYRWFKIFKNNDFNLFDLRKNLENLLKIILILQKKKFYRKGIKNLSERQRAKIINNYGD